MIISDIDHSIKIRKLEELYDLPVYVYVNKFDENAVKQFAIDVERAESTKQSVIPCMIDSFGGYVYSLLAMIDILKQAKKPIATICTGKAMSCGAILFSCGAEGMRYISPNATLMIHDAASMTHGKVEEVKADAVELDRLNKKIYTIMARNCNQNDTYFSDIVHANSHADWFIDAEGAILHRLANHIRVPEFKVKVTLDVQFK